MTLKYRNWGVVAFKDHPRMGEAIGFLQAWARRHGAKLHFHQELSRWLDPSVPCCSDEELLSRSNALLSLGGDGTFLSAAHMGVGRKLPILGINFGRLGFLADIALETAERDLTAIAMGEGLCEERPFLEAQVRRDRKLVWTGLALNEICLQARRLVSMIEVTVSTDDGLLAEYWADGLILSTPTGSTAYSLALGGPIVQPGVAAILITPKAPHSLTVRPMLLPDHHVLQLSTCTPEGAVLVADSRTEFPVEPGDRITVKKSRKTVRVLRPKGLSFAEILRRKMGWSGRPVAHPKDARHV